jgi:hypothetical protein
MWEPTADDIKWTESMVSILCDGGVWAVPASASLYTVYKTKKEYVLTGDPTHECNQRIMEVLSHMGYTQVNNVNSN